MRTDELITAIRLAGKLSSLDPDWTDSVILLESWNVLLAAFVKPVVEVRQGYWLKQYTQALVSGQARYRVVPRAVVGMLEKLELVDSAGNSSRLTATSLQNAPLYENQTGTPSRYTVQDDSVVLLPTPNSASYSLRQTYYLRPSKLETQQASGAGGLITAVNTTARTITINTRPMDRENGNANLATGNTIDVVHASGQFSLPLVNVTQTMTGAGPWVLTVAGTDDMSGVIVGDYVRFADQTDWPCLPLEFHTTLAEATAIMILTKKGDVQKAQSLAGKVQNDIDRFIALACPRVKEALPVLMSRYGVIRQGAGRGSNRYAT